MCQFQYTSNYDNGILSTHLSTLRISGEDGGEEGWRDFFAKRREFYCARSQNPLASYNDFRGKIGHILGKDCFQERCWY